MREEVVEAVVEHKPVEVRQKTRVEMPPIEALPRPVDITTTAMGQWAGGPPKDRRRVVVVQLKAGGR